MAHFNIKINYFVSDNWIEDGVNEKTIKEQLETFLNEQLISYAYAGIETKVKSITVNKTNK